MDNRQELREYISKQTKLDENFMSREQGDKWQKEAIKYLKKNEYEWVTVGIDSNDNSVHIFSKSLPGKLPRGWKDSDFDDVLEMQGKEVLDLKNRVQFVKH